MDNLYRFAIKKNFSKIKLNTHKLLQTISINLKAALERKGRRIKQQQQKRKSTDKKVQALNNKRHKKNVDIIPLNLTKLNYSKII